MLIHKSPYPDLILPPADISLPTFLFRPLSSDNEGASSFTTSRVDQDLVIPPPFHSQHNPQPSRPKSGPLSLRTLKQRAELFAIGLRRSSSIPPAPASPSSSQRQQTLPRVLSIVSENQHDYAAAVLGAHLAGLVVALHNPSYTAAELAHQFRLVKTVAVLSSDKAQSLCLEAFQLGCQKDQDDASDQPLRAAPVVWTFGEPTGQGGSSTEASQKSTDGQDSGAGSSQASSGPNGEKPTASSWFTLFPSSPQPSDISRLWSDHRAHVSAQGPNADAVYCFSSGTSGKPKAVRLTHSNLVANVIQATLLMRDRTCPPLFDRWDPRAERGWYRDAHELHVVVDTCRDRSNSAANAKPAPDVKDCAASTTRGPSSLSDGVPRQDEGDGASYRRELHIDLLPQFHCYGLVVAFVAMHTATPRIVLPRFSLPLFLHVVESMHATFAFVVPPILLALARSPQVDAVNLSSLRRLASGAASLPSCLREEVWNKRGIKVTDGYGMTEMSPIICLQMLEDLDFTPDGASPGGTTPGGTRYRSSVGRLSASTRARVVDVATGQDVRTGERGELLLDGPQKMAGYLRNEEANRNAFVFEEEEEVHDDSKARQHGAAGAANAPSRASWLRTGDVVSIDAHGYITIHDRTKDVIKVKGFQVSPAELEDIIIRRKEVHDVAVVGVPSSVVGSASSESHGDQVPWAFCVPNAANATQLTEPEEQDEVTREVLRYVNAGIAKYKHVKGVTWVEALPKSSSGKVLKKELHVPTK